MNNPIYIFHGDVNVYLQGRNALFAIGNQSDTMNYFIGSPESAMLIRDHRRAPNDAAWQVLHGDYGIEFADIFNQPARIDIEETTEGIVIELHESNKDALNGLILWMGLLEDEMPARPVEWERLIPVENEQIAFAALVS
jgi:hypothetical protein